MKSHAISRRKAIKNTGVALGAASLFPGLLAAGQFQPQTAILEKDELRGKVAIVTGARNNLGRGYAVAFGAAGASVVVHHHLPATRDQAEETVKMVKEAGGKAAIAVGDLGQIKNIENMFDVAIKQFGRVDILVNNAGQIIKKPMTAITEEEFDRLTNINSKGTFFCMREAAKRLSDNGRIINIGTTLFGKLTPNYSVYAGTKAGMEEYARALAREIGKRGITVNVVCPGPIDTPFFHSQEPPGAADYVAKFSVANRIGQIADVVPLVAFLASPKSQWLTGQTFWVNGGYYSR